MSFIYCHQDRRGDRWFYQETPGFREHAPGSSSSFARAKATSYRFATKEEAWEHCRKRRKGGHWSGGGKWIVIKVVDAWTCIRCLDGFRADAPEMFCVNCQRELHGDAPAQLPGEESKG